MKKGFAFKIYTENLTNTFSQPYRGINLIIK